MESEGGGGRRDKPLEHRPSAGEPSESVLGESGVPGGVDVGGLGSEAGLGGEQGDLGGGGDLGGDLGGLDAGEDEEPGAQRP